VLIVFLCLRWILLQNQKAHRLFCRRALGLFELSGRLFQAMAVRRHGCSMMVVMTVMAAALHLFKN
jgi:hypothetical protein